MLKHKDKVMIYEDPISRKKPEGEAELIVLMDENDDMQFWEVKFPDGSVCGRWLMVEND